MTVQLKPLVGRIILMDELDQAFIDIMDNEEYSYFLAYGMTEEQHQLESLIANTRTDS